MRNNHGKRDQPTVGSSEGSFSDKIFFLTNELLPSVQRSRIAFHRGNKDCITALAERRAVLFEEWGMRLDLKILMI